MAMDLKGGNIYKALSTMPGTIITKGLCCHSHHTVLSRSAREAAQSCRMSANRSAGETKATGAVHRHSTAIARRLQGPTRKVECISTNFSKLCQ